MSTRRWTLSPSDFTSLWDACPRCFYLHVARGYPRPQAPASPLATRIKATWAGRRTQTLAPDMPGGVVEIGERRVESEPLDVHLPDAVHRCVIRGAFDTAVRLDDGGYALVELALGPLEADAAAALGRGLLACAHALEHPAAGATALGPVTRLGLLVFEPEKFSAEAGGVGALTGGLTWLEIPREDARLLGFLAEVLSTLERPLPPGGTPLCPWCVYRDVSRRTGL
jgi:hypothetical protein